MTTETPWTRTSAPANDSPSVGTGVTGPCSRRLARSDGTIESPKPDSAPSPHDEFGEVDWDAFDPPIPDGRNAVDASAVDAPVYTIGGRWA